MSEFPPIYGLLLDLREMAAMLTKDTPQQSVEVIASRIVEMIDREFEEASDGSGDED